MIKDTFFSMPRFINLCRKEMVESWRSNVLRIILLYGVMVIVMLWCGYYAYSESARRSDNDEVDPMRMFLLLLFAWSLCGFGCLSASLMMEKMKTKINRISTLMTPATSFEKYFSRWLICTVVFLVAFLLTYKLADYTRVLVYSLAYPEQTCIVPINLLHIVDCTDDYTLNFTVKDFFMMLAAYCFTQSCFVLGSSIWPKNSFLKTFVAGTLIVVVYALVVASLGEVFLRNDRYYHFSDTWSTYKMEMGIAVCLFFALLNWVLAYFRFKESEIINRL